jgi:hypothetical protein
MTEIKRNNRQAQDGYKKNFKSVLAYLRSWDQFG